MDYIKALQDIGYTDKEIKFYTKALELGQFTISSISHESGIKRPTCYLIIDELIKKGLITSIPRGRKTLYHAESPEVIINEMENRVKLAQKILPYLNQIKVKKNNAPSIKFYTGRRGIEAIYGDVLKSKPGTILKSMTPIEQIVNVVGEEFFEDWVKKRADRKIPSENIYPEKDKGYFGLVGTNEKLLRKSKYLPSPFKIPATLGVYNDKVAFFSSKKDNFGFIVTSEEFAETIRGIFDHLWEQGKEN